jgi:hypothetical protein
MLLIDTAVRALEPKATRYSRPDERGLVLEVFPTGGKLWHYRYRPNGKQERVPLGRCPVLALPMRHVHNAKARERALAGGSELVMPGRGTFTEPFVRYAINNVVRAAATIAPALVPITGCAKSHPRFTRLHRGPCSR